MSAGAVLVAISGIGMGSIRESSGLTGKGLGSSVGFGSTFGCSWTKVTINAVACLTASRVGACSNSK